jgi:sec-independent protein translocase protein TatB
MLRTIGKVVTRMRGMAGEFHRHLDAAIREAGIEDVKKEMRNLTSMDDLKKHEKEIKKALDTPAATSALAAETGHVAPARLEDVTPAPAPESSTAAPEETKAAAS